MARTPTNEESREERDCDRLRSTVSPGAVPVDMVSAFAGDRVMTEGEGERVRELRQRRGGLFFSDLLYAISHHYFAPEVARPLWEKVLAHKFMMSEKLGRNVRVAVATLDYLSNITGEVDSFTLMAEAHVNEIVNLSMRDGLTGLFNHSSFYELLELEFRNYRRYGAGVSLILLDIDDFKAVNDSAGHQEGDRILILLADDLRAQSRDSDICCRFGGEEFAVILPFTGEPSDALGIAERIRAGAAQVRRNGRGITLSAGVATCDVSTPTPHALVERADLALYQAKTSGKNRVVFYPGYARPRELVAPAEAR
jgi:two-component system cell cycle response regulator